MAKKKSKKQELEKRFFKQFKKKFPKLPLPVRQHRFHSIRLWRFDFAWPEDKIAVEIQGGGWMAKGGHNTGLGMARDCDKHRTATIMGWRLLSFSSYDLKKKRIKQRRMKKGKRPKLRAVDKICLTDCVILTGRFLARERARRLLNEL